MSRPKAFTLIELLVVVAIITALLAILMPSLAKSIDAAHLAVCGSQQRQMGASLMQYATEHAGRFPESNASAWWGIGVDVAWTSSSSLTWPSYAAEGKGQPMGLSFLLMNGYFETPELLYCPAWTHPYAQLDAVDSAGIDGAGGPNQYGGWPTSPDNPGPTVYRMIAYNYRSSIGKDITTDGWVEAGGRAARLQVDSGATALAADHFTERYVEWDDYTHPAGYMALYLDGSARFNADPNHQYMSDEQGVFSHGQWGTQERIWREFFE